MEESVIKKMWFRFMVFNATSNNVSVISCRKKMCIQKSNGTTFGYGHLSGLANILSGFINFWVVNQNGYLENWYLER
jgi:hypothetical protein